ncbi:MAG: bifunctional helix-turn-helix domain-containing protein/methylated-DNA--[protein]-cysteine S-methyltransferase [Parvularculales bacterium]
MPLSSSILPSPTSQDYDRIASAIEYIQAHYRDQPSLDDIATHIGLSPHHFQKLFSRWAGISPKAFVQSLTLNHAQRLLRDTASILEASLESGLSGPGRLHDLFITHEAMTPGDWKSHGYGLEMFYGFHHSPFGACLLMATERGLAGVAFADNTKVSHTATLEDMTRRWPRARFIENPSKVAPYADRLFFTPTDKTPLHLILIGTDFQIQVWRALLAIPRGVLATYTDVARTAGAGKAARAVGSAVGRNPLSYVVPCHRVVRRDGELGGYHWGLVRKRALLAFETA